MDLITIFKAVYTGIKRGIKVAVHPFDDLYSLFYGSKNEGNIKTYYDAYIKNVWVRRGINLITNKISTLPWGIYKNNKENKLIQTVFEKNGYMTEQDFVKLIIFWSKIEGFCIIKYDKLNLFIYESNLIYNENGELWYVKNIKREKINLNECVIYQNDATEPFGLGHSAIEPLIGSTQRQSSLEFAMKNMIENGATPSFFMLNNESLDSDEVQKKADSFNDKYSGMRKAGRSPWISGGWNIQQVGMNIRDMDITSIVNLTKNDVSTCLGIPISLMNDTESSTASRDKMQEDRKSLLYDTIIPEGNKLTLFFNTFLIPKIGKGGGEWKFDYTEMADMCKDKLLQAQIDSIYIDKRVTNPNEVRETLHKDPYKGGDEFLAPFNLAPVGELMSEKSLKNLNNARVLAIKALEKDILEQRWKTYYAKAHSQEKKTTKTLGKFFDKMINDVLKRVKSKALIPKDEYMKLFAKMLTPLMLSFAQQSGDDTVDEYGLGYDFIVGDDLKKFIDAKLIKSADKVVNTCEESIRRAIDGAIKEGLGAEEQAKLIQEAVKKKGEEMKRSNAKRIARTEVNAINSKSSLVAADKGGMSKKGWLSSGLDTSRHGGMDGKWVPINEQFTVYNDITHETDKMDYPSDPNGSAGNVINCMCSIMYK